MRVRSRFLSLLLCGGMLFSLSAPLVFAEGNDAGEVLDSGRAAPARMSARAAVDTGDFTVTGGTAGMDYSFDSTDHVLTILTDTPLTIGNANPGVATDNRIKVSGGIAANLTLANVSIDMGNNFLPAFEIEEYRHPQFPDAFPDRSTTTLTLADGTSNTLKSGPGRAGLQKNGMYNSVVIQCERAGADHTCNDTCGALIATGGRSTGTSASSVGGGAGIGGGDKSNGYNITINGGRITATGGTPPSNIGGSNGFGGGAGIGGGSASNTSAGNGSNITINGGIITATPGSEALGTRYGAGIGGGYFGDGSRITIQGGTVDSTGNSGSAGIGGGADGNGSDILISGGTVKGTGGIYAAGIGGGSQGYGQVTIKAGTVTAVAGGAAACVGGGSGKSGTVTISGGTVTALARPQSGSIGIGGNGGTITISGGTVAAAGDLWEEGIGGDNSKVTVSGGIVTATGGSSATAIGGSRGQVTISGGTVTATGGSGGISGTFSTNVTTTRAFGGKGNAFIDASGITDNDDTTAWSGVIIQGDEGRVYGASVTLTTDATLSGGKTITLDENQTLTIGSGTTFTITDGKVQNAGTIQNDGTVTVTKGEIDSSVGAGGKTTGAKPAGILLIYKVDTSGLQNVSVSGEKKANNNEDYTTTLTADPGYSLPDTVSVTMNGGPYPSCSYDKDTGALSVITKDTITGTLALSAAAVELPKRTVSVRAEPAAGGTVSGGGAYPENTAATVAASPNSGYRFVKWTEGGNTVSENATYSFSVTKDRSLIAVFEPDSGSHTHSYGPWIPNGDGLQHKRVCSGDSNHVELERCSGGTATCRSPAVCSVCGQSYGEKDSGRHAGGTEVRNKTEATAAAPGYSGDTYCKGCGVKIATGVTIPATGGGASGDHSGGGGSGESGAPVSEAENPHTGTEGSLAGVYLALAAGILAVLFRRRKSG